MRQKVLYGSIIIFLITPVLVLSAPFVKSHTGLINAPIAEVVPHFGIEVSGSAIAYKGVGIESGKTKIDWDARLTAGLLDRVELGVTALTEKLYTGSFKLKFLDESGDYIPSAAWGIRDIHGRTDISSTGTSSNSLSDQNNSIYFVASKNFNIQGIKFALHLGLGTNGFKADTPILKKFGGAFGGIQFPIPLDILQDLSFLGEMDGKHVNAGFQYVLPFYGIKVGVAAMSIDRLRGEGGNTAFGEGEGLSFGGGITISSKGLGLW